ncbi:MAG: EAL domain-containing protein [Gammaproteobacteria bacterium]|nr:EAL domain-containing protein [Gammaproteobacteria bacterium]
MPLSRQLISVMFLLFILVFSGTFAINTHNTREYLINQLESHAQDTATSLGLSLTDPYSKNDIPLVNSMVDAIFDRGYYQEIIIRKIDGGSDLVRKQEVAIKGVPQWFVNILPLKVPVGESLITVGWTQKATITVRSHPGFAYVELWNSVVSSFWWSVGSFLLAILVVVVVIRLVLKPLSQMEAQALAIADREFPILEQIPFTREFRRTVVAMNKMSQKVKQMFEEQSGLADKLRQEVYIDSITGLANRKALEMRAKQIISDEKYLFGTLYMLQIKGLAEYNDRQGYAAGDVLIDNTADVLKNICKKHPVSIPARIGGADFVVFVPGITLKQAEEMAEELSHKMTNLPMNKENMPIGHIGAAYYHGKTELTELLAEADMALRSAQQKGAYGWHIYDKEVSKELEIHSANEWRLIIEQYLEEERLFLLYQPAISSLDNQIMHYEVLLRVHSKDGDDIPAGIFLPMAERFSHLGLTTRIDQYVIERVLQRLSDDKESNNKYAINISPSSLQDQEFVAWLETTVKNSTKLAHRLIFETSEYGVLANLEWLKILSSKLRKHGVSFSLDHFGTGLVPFGYLSGLKLDYIKIDGSYIHNFIADKENQFYVQSITQIAHSLDIQVIAEFIESEEDWTRLREMYVDGGQGYYLGKPQSSTG